MTIFLLLVIIVLLVTKSGLIKFGGFSWKKRVPKEGEIRYITKFTWIPRVGNDTRDGETIETTVWLKAIRLQQRYVKANTPYGSYSGWTDLSWNEEEMDETKWDYS